LIEFKLSVILITCGMSPYNCRRINVQKLNDIFYRRAELGRLEAEAGICTGDERYIRQAPIA